jgi:hypothetical protein
MDLIWNDFLGICLIISISYSVYCVLEDKR